MLLECFGFNQDPFGATPDPRCLYQSKTHREALASLKYGFYSNRGFTALIAPPGMGKTTLLNRFLEDIRKSARTVFLFNIDSQCEPRELLCFILRDIGITPKRSISEIHEQLNEAIAKEARAGRRFTIVIDEAQNLSDAALEKIRMLTNFETQTGKLVQIVLAGQPQLSDRLMQPSLVQLRQRISAICHLMPFTPEETRDYIGHHLKCAGYNGEVLFTPGALRLIEDASQGIPRIINNICFNALSLCRALKKKQVDASVVAEAIADQQLVAQIQVATVPPAPTMGRQPDERWMRVTQPRNLRVVVAVSSAILLACMLGAFGLFGIGNRGFRIGGVRSLLQEVDAGSKPQMATGPNEMLQGVIARLPGNLNPNRIDSAYIKVRPTTVANGATGNNASATKPVVPIQQTGLPGTGSITTGRELYKIHMPPETTYAPDGIPDNSKPSAQLETGTNKDFGDVGLAELSSRDEIGSIFRDSQGPKVKVDAPKAITISGDIANGLLIKKIHPLYPIFAREAGITGEVLLQVKISKTGSVESLKVLSGPAPLRQAAIDAVGSWRFKPYMLNNEPTAAETKVNVSFKLGG